MSNHNPDCTHGGAHAPSECRDRYGVPLKLIPAPEAPGLHPITAQELNSAVDEVVEAGDDALKLLLAAAGNIEHAEHPQ